MATTPSKPVLGRQTSDLRHIPSFNCFGSMAAEDVFTEVVAAPQPRPATLSVSVPNNTNKPAGMSMIDRRWSMDSDNSASTPPSRQSSSLSSSFGETFRRALYEHMRGN